MDIGSLNSKLRAEPRICAQKQGDMLAEYLFDAYVYVNARELCGNAAKPGLFFVRRTIDWDQHCGANAFWRFLPYLIQPRFFERGYFFRNSRRLPN
jgi:hypothetical protein